MRKSKKLSAQSKSFIKGKVCLVSGAAGSIGGALSRRLLKLQPKKLVVLDNNESGLFELWEESRSAKVKMEIVSVRDEIELRRVFQKHKPHYVFHAAALKHVIPMERQPLEAFKTNLGGTINIVEASVENGVEKFVFVSTDKAVKPGTIMGLSKKYGEKVCKLANCLGKTKFIIVRFGNVMASRGSVVPIFKRQIEENRPVTVTSPKMRRFFMGIYEAVELVLKAAEIGVGGETFIFEMGEEIAISDLAKMMVKLSGKDIPIEIIGMQDEAEKYSEELYDESLEKITKRFDRMFIVK